MSGEIVISRAAKYGRVPMSVLFCADPDDPCSGDDCRLYAYLTTFDYKETHEVWPGRERAREDLSWSIRKLDGHLARLARHGHIARRQAGDGRPAVIDLLAEVITDSGLQDRAALPDHVDSPARSGNRTSSRTRKERSDREDDSARLQAAQELMFTRNEQHRAELEAQLDRDGVAPMPADIRDRLRPAS